MPIRRVVAIAIIGLLLCVSTSACGTSGERSRTSHRTVAAANTPNVDLTSHKAPHSPILDKDDDYDQGTSRNYYDRDDSEIWLYPRRLTSPHAYAIAKLVRRYLEVALAGDGATACSLLYSLVAESIEDTNGRPPGRSPYQEVEPCSAIVTRLFKQNHAQLAAEMRTLQVSGVYTNGRRGIVLLHVDNMPPHAITIHREFGTWKISDILDEKSV